METLELTKPVSNPLSLFEGEQVPVTYQQIRNLERAMTEELTPVDYESTLQHEFIDGVYLRKGFLKAGHVYVGKVHAEEHMFVVVTGHIVVASEDGGRKEYFPGDVCVSGPGMKRATYAIEDSICFNVHTNKDNERDLLRLEAKFIIPEGIGYDKKEELTCG